jgi:excisionase family DNA binding protein
MNGISSGFDSKLEIEPLWTVSDVANYLRLKPDTVRAMTRRGELPVFKFGRVLRFSPKAIQEWLQSKSELSLSVNVSGEEEL